MKKTSTCLAVAGVLLITACGDDTEDAFSAVCDAQGDVADDLAALASIDPTSATSGEFKDAVEDLSSSVDDLREARGDLAEQDVDNVTNAFDALRSDLDDLDDVPMTDLESAVQIEVIEAIAEFQVAYETAYANSDC